MPVTTQQTLRQVHIKYPILTGTPDKIIFRARKHEQAQIDTLEIFEDTIDCLVEQKLGELAIDMKEKRPDSPLDDAVIKYIFSAGGNIPKEIIVDGEYENLYERLKKLGFRGSAIATPGRSTVFYYPTDRDRDSSS